MRASSFTMALAIAALSSPGLARADTPRPKTWASCVEHVPKGATRPKIEEAFPDRGTSGWASTLTVTVTHAAPSHLLADSPDGAPLAIRRTRAGDAWDRSQAESCGVPTSGSAAEGGTAAAGPVKLGLPMLRIGV